MFKKPIKIGAQNQLSGKDRKTIKTKLSQLFNPDCVQALLNKNDKIVSCKTSGGSKMIIYQGNQYPLLVDGTGKSDFFPTIYTVEAYETLIKCIELNEGVEAYIFNGANLMWAGVRSYSQLKDFSKDEVIGVRNSKGEVVGVGALGCSKKQLDSNTDKSGVAVYMLHYRGDKLWETGPKSAVEVIVKGEKKKEEVIEEKVEQKPAEEKKQKKEKQSKNTKKKQKQPEPEKDEKQEKPAKSDSESSSDSELDFSNFIPTKGQESKPKQEVKVQKIQKGGFIDDDDHRKGGGKKKGGKKGKGKGKRDDDFSDEEKIVEKKEEQALKSAISMKLMDQHFKECFLNALKLCKLDKELPIDSGRFYMDYMLLARPEGVKLEIKDSSYKKLGKFYEEMSKQKFIEFKHAKDKKGQQGATINKIFYENEQLSSYEPTVFRLGEKQAEKKEEEEDETQNNALVKKKKLTISKTFNVNIAYKPSQQLKKFLFPRTVNYIPTQEQEEEMKKQQEYIDSLPQHFSEHEIKGIIEERINKINLNKSKKNDKAEKDKIVAIDYHELPDLAVILKKEIQEFEQNVSVSGSDGQEEKEEKGKKKKGQKKGPRLMKMDRQVLVNKLMKKCSTSHHITDKDQKLDVFREGAFKGIQIIAEKANNKNITKLIGLQTFITPKQQAQEQLNWLAYVLQQKFACSVNLQNLPGKNAGKELIAHGNFINDLQEMLIGEYGLKKQYITLQNKLDKKKKNH